MFKEIDGLVDSQFNNFKLDFQSWLSNKVINVRTINAYKMNLMLHYYFSFGEVRKMVLEGIVL